MKVEPGLTNFAQVANTDDSSELQSSDAECHIIAASEVLAR